MSRRTKLIVFVLFIALAVVPAGYVMLTWHIQPPLRFRALTFTADVEQPDAPWSTKGALTLEIENTSNVPVHVEHAGVGLRGIQGSIVFFNYDSPSESKSIVIPGKSVVTATSHWQIHNTLAPGFTGVEADYEWSTRPRNYWVHFFEWMTEKIPAMKKSGRAHSQWYSDTTALDPPSKIIGVEGTKE